MAAIQQTDQEKDVQSLQVILIIKWRSSTAIIAERFTPHSALGKGVSWQAAREAGTSLRAAELGCTGVQKAVVWLSLPQPLRVPPVLRPGHMQPRRCGSTRTEGN